MSPVVTLLLLPGAALHEEPAKASLLLMPLYSATSARTGPELLALTLTVVTPALALVRYQRELTPDEAAWVQAPLRLSVTDVPDAVRNIPVRRSPARTPFASWTVSPVPASSDALAWTNRGTAVLEDSWVAGDKLVDNSNTAKPTISAAGQRRFPTANFMGASMSKPTPPPHAEHVLTRRNLSDALSQLNNGEVRSGGSRSMFQAPLGC